MSLCVVYFLLNIVSSGSGFFSPQRKISLSLWLSYVVRVLWPKSTLADWGQGMPESHTVPQTSCERFIGGGVIQRLPLSRTEEKEQPGKALVFLRGTAVHRVFFRRDMAYVHRKNTLLVVTVDMCSVWLAGGIELLRVGWGLSNTIILACLFSAMSTLWGQRLCFTPYISAPGKGVFVEWIKC